MLRRLSTRHLCKTDTSLRRTVEAGLDGVRLRELTVCQFEEFFKFSLVRQASLESLKSTLGKVTIIFLFCYFSAF